MKGNLTSASANPRTPVHVPSRARNSRYAFAHELWGPLQAICPPSIWRVLFPSSSKSRRRRRKRRSRKRKSFSWRSPSRKAKRKRATRRRLPTTPIWNSPSPCPRRSMRKARRKTPTPPAPPAPPCQQPPLPVIYNLGQKSSFTLRKIVFRNQILIY